jgi:hypothetical protein
MGEHPFQALALVGRACLELLGVAKHRIGGKTGRQTLCIE